MYKTINIPFTVISAREFRAGCIVGNKPSTNSLCARCFNLICLYSAVWSHATFLFIREQWQVNDYILDLCRKARFLARLLPVVFLWMSAGWRSELTCLYMLSRFRASVKLPHAELQKFMFAPKQSDHLTTSSSLRNIYFMWEFPAGRTGGGCWSRLFDSRCGSFTTVDTSSQLLKTHRPFSGCCFLRGRICCL